MSQIKGKLVIVYPLWHCKDINEMGGDLMTKE